MALGPSDSPPSSGEPLPSGHPDACTPPVPPVAEQRPYSSMHHGVTIDDPWHWLRDPGYPQVEDPDVLAYLTAENDYFEAEMSPHRGLMDTIFEEIKARQQPDLSSVPWRRGDWYYQWSFQEGSQYRLWQRWPAGNPGTREGPPSDAQTILGRTGPGRRLRVLSPRLHVGEQRRIFDGLQHRHRRLRALPHGRQGPGLRGTSRRRNRRHHGQRRLGRRRRLFLLHSG